MELKAKKEEKQDVETKLSSIKILGREFEDLADKYWKLRQEIDTKKWALEELSHYNQK